MLKYSDLYFRKGIEVLKRFMNSYVMQDFN